MVARTTAALKNIYLAFKVSPKTVRIGQFLFFYRVFSLPEWHLIGLFQSAVERAMLKHRSSTD